MSEKPVPFQLYWGTHDEEHWSVWWREDTTPDQWREDVRRAAQEACKEDTKKPYEERAISGGSTVFRAVEDWLEKHMGYERIDPPTALLPVHGCLFASSPRREDQIDEEWREYLGPDVYDPVHEYVSDYFWGDIKEKMRAESNEGQGSDDVEPPVV